jgi:hypothetical protein
MARPPEEGRQPKARQLRSAVETGRAELSAPGTLLPEAFNALSRLHRHLGFAEKSIDSPEPAVVSAHHAAPRSDGR